MESRVKTFKFKKISWYGCGRKINQPEVTMTLKYDSENRPCLSICGNIWNCHHTDIVCGGQNLDDMAEFESMSLNPTFSKLYYLWNNYHLNDCRSGTPLQEAALHDYHSYCKENSIINLNSYDADVEYLKSIGLYNDNGYIYGTSWLYREIPNKDLQMIDDLFNE